ncbi:MAG: O-antigen ligase family protein, partial [Thermoanaerobaculia bacterium]|nr:O-antigen ligase family protein [Thermoanaerobaculia bacterium]
SLALPWGVSLGGSRLGGGPLLVPVVVGLLLLTIVLRRRGVGLRWSGPEPVLAALCLSALVSLVYGNSLVFARSPAPLPAQVAQLGVVWLSAATFVLVAWGVRSTVWLRRLTLLFLALGSVYVLGRLGQSLSPLIALFPDGAVGSLFWTWLAAMGAALALLDTSMRTPLRLALGALVVLAFWVALAQSARWISGWLPPAIAVSAVLLVARPWLGLPVVGAAVGVGLWRLDWLLENLVVTNSYSLMTRLEAWKVVVDIIETSALLGTGPANYYWYASTYPILGWYVPFSSHNQYLDLVAQVGLVGAALFLWFCWRVGRVCWCETREAPEGGFERAFAIGALGGLVGSLAAGGLADWILPFVYNTGLKTMASSLLFWLFLGGVVAQRRARAGVVVPEPGAAAAPPVSRWVPAVGAVGQR